MSELESHIKKLTDTTKSDLFLFSATINDKNADDFIMKVRNKKQRKENCSLILATFGGNPDAGFRIIRIIKKYYKKLYLYIFGTCKSTGTLMALGADEIIMGDFGEFGPLDIQLTKDDELSNTSGLSYLQSLISLNEQLFRSFEESFINLKQKSGYTITTKTAAEIASKLAVGLVAPISAQIDPIKLGEVQRAMKIAREYGKRLSEKNELIVKLIVGYPSHGFVIDYQEAKESFDNVRIPTDDEVTLEKLLFEYVRHERENDVIIEFSNETIEEKQNGEGGNNARTKSLSQKNQTIKNSSTEIIEDYEKSN